MIYGQESPEEDTLDTMKKRGIRYGEGRYEGVVDEVITESTLNLYLNNEFVTRMIATDEQLDYLGAGFMIASGVADSVSTVEVTGNDIYVISKKCYVPDWKVCSAGGCESSLEVPEVNSEITLTPEQVIEIREAIETDIWSRTGGIHCSVLFHEGELAERVCDVGRHNTFDKLIGYAELNGINRSRCVIGSSGRQPSAMVSKAAHAGIPVIVSRASATSGGVEIAEKSGITLICFARNGRFTIYTHPERIVGALD